MKRRHFWGKNVVEAPETVPDMFDEIARFLQGQLLSTFNGNWDVVPDWVWVSVLAHWSEERLVSCAAEGEASAGVGNRCDWDRTLTFLAQVLLDHAERTGEPVSLLQHDIVLPIEHRVGERSLAPPAFVRLVLSGLHEREKLQRSAPRR